MSARPHILFLAEGVSLSHVGRCLYFGGLTDPARFRVSIATDPAHEALVRASNLRHVTMHAADGHRFLRNAQRGLPLFDLKTLESHFEEDRRLFEAERPDFIVADMRLSVIASAPLHKIPYALISNSYWQRTMTEMGPIPAHPIQTVFGRTFFNGFRRVFGRAIERAMAKPLRQLRRRHGLAELGADLFEVNAMGDFALFADDPMLHRPAARAPGNHYQVGPALWQLEVPVPEWWEDVSRRRPLVYVNLGSSGDPSALKPIARALARSPFTALICLCGAKQPPVERGNIFYCDYFPNQLAAEAADVVVCNGGSTSGYLSAVSGTPFIGITSNMEQALSMLGFAESGLAVGIDQHDLSERTFAEALQRVLQESSYRERSRAYRAAFDANEQAKRWNRLLDQLVPTARASAA